MKPSCYSFPLLVSLLAACSKSPEEPKPTGDRAKTIEAQHAAPAATQVGSPDSFAGVPNDPPSPTRQRVADRLTKSFGDASTQAVMPIEKAQVAWRDSWLPAYNEPLPSASNVRVQQGLDLPPEVASLKPPTKPYLLQTRQGQFDLGKSDDEVESLACLHMLLVGTMLDGGYRVPDLLSDRIDELPPTRGDLLTLQIFRDAMQLKERADIPLTESQAEAWERMGNARNPIYRHIALTFYPRIAASEAALRFFQGIATETDTQNLLLIVSNVEALPRGIGLSYLEALQARLKDGTNDAVAAAIDTAIENIKQRQR